MGDKYTPTQQRIMLVLGDGAAHTRQELRDCLEDELAGRSALSFHLSNIRKYLRPKGQDIVCCLQNKRIMYRLVRLISQD
jgi:hypothetical protein